MRRARQKTSGRQDYRIEYLMNKDSPSLESGGEKYIIRDISISGLKFSDIGEKIKPGKFLDGVIYLHAGKVHFNGNVYARNYWRIIKFLKELDSSVISDEWRFCRKNNLEYKVNGRYKG